VRPHHGREQAAVDLPDIGNLAQDTTPALVHFPDGTTQQWLLVRMEEPGGTQ
jgi:hypothetical protein